MSSAPVVTAKVGLDTKEALAVLDKLAASIAQLTQLLAQKFEIQLDTTEAETKTKKLGDDVDAALKKGAAKGGKSFADGIAGNINKAGSAVSGFIGGAVGGFGFSAVMGFMEKAIHKGEAVMETNEQLKLSFVNAGLPAEKIPEAMESANKFAGKLSKQWAMSGGEIKTLLSQVQGLSGFTGKTSENLTKLAIGVEKSSGGLLGAESFVRAIVKGVDPENAEAVEKITKKYPKLGEVMKSNLSVQEKIDAAMAVMGDTFGEIEEQAKGPLGAMDRINMSINKIFGAVGAPLLEAIGPVLDGIASALEPILGAIGPLIKDLVEGIKPLLDAVSGPIAEGIKGILNPILDIVKALLPPIGQLITIAIKPLAALITIVAQLVAELLTPVLGALKPLLATISKLFEKLTPVIETIVVKALDPFAKLIRSIIPIIVKLVTGAMNYLVALLEELIPVIVEVVPAIATLLSAFSEIQSVIAELVFNVLSQLITNLGGTVENFSLMKVAVALVTGPIKVFAEIVKGVAAVLNFVATAAKGVVGAIGDIVLAVVALDPVKIAKAFSGFGDRVAAEFKQAREASQEFKQEQQEPAPGGEPNINLGGPSVEDIQKQMEAANKVFAKFRADQETEAKKEAERVARLVADNKISEEQAKKRLAAFKVKQLEDLQNEAKKILRINADAEGFFRSSAFEAQIKAAQSATIAGFKKGRDQLVTEGKLTREAANEEIKKFTQELFANSVDTSQFESLFNDITIGLSTAIREAKALDPKLLVPQGDVPVSVNVLARRTNFKEQLARDFAAAEKEFDAIKQRQADDLRTYQDRQSEMVARNIITQEQADERIRRMQSLQAQELAERSSQLFRANVDENGIFVSTAFNTLGEETVKKIKSFVNDTRFAFRGAFRAIRNDARSELKDAANTFAEALKAFNIADAIAQQVSQAEAARQSALAGIKEEEKALLASLKKREIGYTAYIDKAVELNRRASATIQPLFNTAVNSLNNAIAAGFTGLIGTQRKQLDGVKDLGDAWDELGIITASAFGVMVTEGQNAVKALVLASLDGLNALVPIVVAKIFAEWSSPWLIAGGAIATAAFLGLVAAARASVSNGFEKGGRVKGGEQMIRINERGEEYVVNAGATRRYEPILEGINKNKRIEDVIAHAVTRKQLDRDLLLTKLGITFDENTQRGSIVVQELRERQQTDNKQMPALLQKIDALTTEVTKLRNEARSTHRTEVTVPVDESALDRRAARRTIEYATKW